MLLFFILYLKSAFHQIYLRILKKKILLTFIISNKLNKLFVLSSTTKSSDIKNAIIRKKTSVCHIFALAITYILNIIQVLKFIV